MGSRDGNALLGVKDRRRLLVRLCALTCLLNVLLTLGLAGAGVLKSAQPGDVTYTRVEQVPDGRIVLPEGSPARFAVESPTDADAFYNAVVRVTNGAPLYTENGGDGVQPYHYAPVTVFAFVLPYFLGYVGFKTALLVASVVAVAGGTYLLLRSTARFADVHLSPRTATVLGVASVGFSPMVSNFKVGQTAPLMYAGIAAAWWLGTARRDGPAGVAMAVPALLKPYLTAPLVALVHFRRWRVAAGLLAAMVAANVAGVVAFGFDTTLAYYGVVYDAALGGEAPVGTASVADWSVEALEPLFFLGPLAVVGRVVVAAIGGAVVLSNARSLGRYDAEAFSLSLVTVAFVVRQVTVIDVAVVLAAFVVLGARVYHSRGHHFEALAAAFLLTMAHPYAMEVLVGRGHANLVSLAGEASPALAVLPFLQPGIYALYVLLAVGVAAWGRRVDARTVTDWLATVRD